MGYRSCLGLLKLSRRFEPGRLEKASARAMRVRARSCQFLETVLENGLEEMPLPNEAAAPEPAPIVHENLRGAEYYH